jgi:thioredoxin 1
MAIVTLTKDNFDEFISGGPVLVDFWASWCGPCRMIAPAIEAVAEKFDGKANVGKVNIDEEMELALRYKVMSIPTVMTFKSGEVVSTKIGAETQDVYENMLLDIIG